MFKKVVLDNGIPLLMERTPAAYSVCIGIWVRVGARNENQAKNGISHFLEHMFFKGTEKMSAQDIAMETDAIGAELNAVTSSEYTLFYIKALDEYIDRSAGLLQDIFLHSTFPRKEIEKEKNIVFEEIKMVEDNPADYIHELFARHIWGEEGLGQSVLGQRETISSFTRQNLLDHIWQFYGPHNIIVACSGNFSEDELRAYLGRTLGRLKKSGDNRPVLPSRFRSDVQIVTKELAETHLCLGLEGLPYNSGDRYAMYLLNTILGSGFSSRLFQKVREKRGLVYSIYSYHTAYADTGLWAIYAGTDRKNANEVISIAVDEIKNLHHSITSEELIRAKAQLKGNLLLALEATSSKMTNIAKQEIYYRKYLSPKKVMALVDSVTLERMKDLARNIAAERPVALTVYGPVKEKDIRGSCRLLR